MNQPKKTIFAALGIAASVGCASLMGISPGTSTQGDSICYSAGSYYTPPPPAPKKPLREGDIRVKCKRCGQKYDRPGRCTFAPSAEEVKHFHLTPEEEASSRKAVLKLLDNVASWQKLVKH
ncbi:hypothetical protein [Armatimonas sp.]|uniref:hypothetical protein n=1 Tax=Armatimonas sp. TaxID=1872638 RepID=UPI003752BB26